MQMSNPEKQNYLYLYDLPKESTSSVKIALIIKEKTGYVLEIKPQIRRDLNRPFCTAIVNIPDNEAFAKACETLRYFDYEGKCCRGLPFDNSLHGANQQRLVEQNVFISKIPRDEFHNAKWLHEELQKHGPIKSLKISLEPTHESRGYGYVCFQEVDGAQKCLAALGNNDVVRSMKYTPRDKRDFRRVFNNIYAKNLPDDFDEAKTRALFSKYGPIGMLKFDRNEFGAYAMIAYFSDNDDRTAGPQAAQAACDELNGKELNGKKIYVKPFLNTQARKQEILREAMKYKNSKKKCNLFVKNIPDACSEKDIRDLFGKFGEIESVRLFAKEKGKNPYCFVCFLRPDSASKAISELHNADFQGRALQINHYEIKEIRKLQNEENQDKIDFMRFRQKYGLQQPAMGYKPEVLFEMLKKLLQEMPAGYNKPGARPAHGAPYPMQNQGQPRTNMGNKGPYGANREAGRSQPRNNMGPIGQNPKVMQGQMQPMQQMPIQQNNIMGGFAQQPMQPPTSVKEAYLMRCAPLVKAVVAENPYYKNTVGTAIFDFVQGLKGDKAPKITGMLIDLNIPEIHTILQNYEHFCMRVEQASQLINQQMQQAAQQQQQ